ncbi:unnamed protein product [Cylindrotheca closterium]|uniref:Uncharacterized protein n=1 Tax=Cylindrotheca closterium TaxID=2856 RepID=A0AAD2G8K2_9STRA|nr:unnamed protein product [Cylindrotheca closterium]
MSTQRELRAQPREQTREQRPTLSRGGSVSSRSSHASLGLGSNSPTQPSTTRHRPPGDCPESLEHILVEVLSIEVPRPGYPTSVRLTGFQAYRDSPPSFEQQDKNRSLPGSRFARTPAQNGHFVRGLSAGLWQHGRLGFRYMDKASLERTGEHGHLCGL